MLMYNSAILFGKVVCNLGCSDCMECSLDTGKDVDKVMQICLMYDTLDGFRAIQLGRN